MAKASRKARPKEADPSEEAQREPGGPEAIRLKTEEVTWHVSLVVLGYSVSEIDRPRAVALARALKARHPRAAVQVHVTERFGDRHVVSAFLTPLRLVGIVADDTFGTVGETAARQVRATEAARTRERATRDVLAFAAGWLVAHPPGQEATTQKGQGVGGDEPAPA